MRRSGVTAILVAAMAVGAIGCSGGGTSDTAATNGPQASGVPPATAKDRQMVGNMYTTGLPIVKDKVTLKGVMSKASTQAKSIEQLKVVQDAEARTNVKIAWEQIPAASFKEKKNLILASGDLPDFFAGGLEDVDIATYGSQGMLVPLEQLIDKYAPNVKKVLEARPEYKKGVTASDGHIYTLPLVEEQEFLKFYDGLMINTKWLAKLNLKMPTTPDELVQVLRAFKDKDPNGNGKQDEIPYSFIYGMAPYGIYSMFGAFGLTDNTNHLVVKNGKLVFTAVQPEYKEAVKWYAQLHKEGLIDKESLTQDDKVFFSKGREGILGVFSGVSENNMIAEKDFGTYAAVPPLKGPSGEQVWSRQYPGFSRSGFAITKANKNPEITMRWIDAMYTDKIGLEWRMGPIGINLKENGDGSFEYMETPQGMAYGEFRHSEAPGSVSPVAVLSETFNKLKMQTAQQIRQNSYLIYKPFLEKEIYPIAFFSIEDLTRINTLKTDIYGLINKKQAEWIAKGTIDAEWNDYVSQLNKMGLDEMMKLYQKYYDKSK
ncbi:extracellular solute-binding protein [Paenibacillus cymbidii]|uniref:extracellular solute-binding protein n=1 Tax=Paenibacillus cymbidii TaxID=1639034 RepID=UPI0010820237|nr:extracellular solute-binding protein [Paenibacillus cymbidii]